MCDIIPGFMKWGLNLGLQACQVSYMLALSPLVLGRNRVSCIQEWEWLKTCCVAEDGVELLILLPPSLKCWDYRHVLHYTWLALLGSNSVLCSIYPTTPLLTIPLLTLPLPPISLPSPSLPIPTILPP